MKGITFQVYLVFFISIHQLSAQKELSYDDVLDPGMVDRLVIVQSRQEESYGQVRERKKTKIYGHVKGSKELLQLEIRDGYGTEKYDYDVDANGNVLTQYFLSYEGKRLMNKYKYEDNLLRKSIQWISGEQNNIKYYRYNSKRQLIYDSTNFIRDDTISYYYTRRYKYENGLQIEYLSFSSYSSSDINRHTYAYDENGLMISETSYYSDGSVYATWEYEYDENNFILKRYLTGIGKPERRILYQNRIKVDEKGNWIRLESEGSLGGTVVRTITYR